MKRKQHNFQESQSIKNLVLKWRNAADQLLFMVQKLLTYISKCLNPVSLPSQWGCKSQFLHTGPEPRKKTFGVKSLCQIKYVGSSDLHARLGGAQFASELETHDPFGNPYKKQPKNSIVVAVLCFSYFLLLLLLIISVDLLSRLF